MPFILLLHAHRVKLRNAHRVKLKIAHRVKLRNVFHGTHQNYSIGRTKSDPNKTQLHKIKNEFQPFLHSKLKTQNKYID